MRYTSHIYISNIGFIRSHTHIGFKVEAYAIICSRVCMYMYWIYINNIVLNHVNVGFKVVVCTRTLYIICIFILTYIYIYVYILTASLSPLTASCGLSAAFTNNVIYVIYMYYM